MRKGGSFCVTMLCCGLLLSAFAAAGRSAFISAAAKASDAQTAPQRPSSTQTPVPGLPKSERVAPQRGKTEQYTLSEDRYEKAVAYSRAAYTLYFVSYFVSFVVLLLLLQLGVAARFRDFAEHVTGRRWLQAFVFVPLLILTSDIFDLPVRLYWHSLSLRYEQSVQRWGSWFWDWTKEELVGTFFALILVLILFAVIRRSPRRWWLYFWFAALPVLLGIIFINPLVIDPLFNKFEPLDKEHPQLVDAVQKLTRNAGVPIPRERIFLMRASEKSNEINAYVTGLGASKRVVVWDTTLQKTANDEALFIIGHELGHYVLGHVWKGFLYGALGLLVALYLIFRGWLEVIHGIVPNSEEVAAHAFQILGEVDLSDPNPPAFITFWLYSHPPLAERLVFAYSYDPWSKGKSPKYVKAHAN